MHFRVVAGPSIFFFTFQVAPSNKSTSKSVGVWIRRNEKLSLIALSINFSKFIFEFILFILELTIKLIFLFLSFKFAKLSGPLEIEALATN